MITTIRLADHGRFFATRSLAAKIREQAEAVSGIIVLDFTGTGAMTVSFGDELAGKLLASGREVRFGFCKRHLRPEYHPEDIRRMLPGKIAMALRRFR